MSKSKRQIKAAPLAKALKKSWYSLVAPGLFNKQVIGYSFVAGPELLLHKAIATNAMAVTGDIKKQHIIVTVKVDQIKDNQGFTSIESFEINPAYIKRLVRRGRNKLDMSFSAVTKDHVHVSVKPLLLTKAKATGSICAALRKKAKDFLTRQLKTMTFEEAISDLLSMKLQNVVRSEMKKIYPVKNAEIRVLSREHNAGAGEEHAQKEEAGEMPETAAEGDTIEDKTNTKKRIVKKKESSPEQETTA